MIALVRGKLVSRESDGVIVDVNGIGFFVRISAGAWTRLPAIGEELTLHTHLVLQSQQDEVKLFGFPTPKERNAFAAFIDIPNVGPSLALAILSTLTVDDVAAAILQEDPQRLTRVPGIGAKKAAKLALELKDRFDRIFTDPLTLSPAAVPATTDPVATTTREALLSLGFPAAEIDRRLTSLGNLSSLSVEERIQRFLRHAGGRED